LDDVVGGFFRGFGIAGHVIADVVFHEFGHKAVDGPAGGGEALKGVGARLILVECTKDAFELADDFFGAVDEIEFFSGGVRHFSCLPYGGMVSKDVGLMQGPQAWYSKGVCGFKGPVFPAAFIVHSSAVN